MLLISFVALIANSALLSDASDLGSPKLNNFDWDLMADDRPWYLLLQDSRIFDKNLDCPSSTFSSPASDISLFTTVVYDIGAQNYLTYQGFARNWDSNGYFEVIHEMSIWTGKFRMLAIDYDRYLIVEHLNPKTVYVGFRSSRPDLETWLRVQQDLLQNGIDIKQLIKWPTNHCQ